MLAIALAASASSRNIAWRPLSCARSCINVNTIISDGRVIPKSLDARLTKSDVTMLLTAPPPPKQEDVISKVIIPIPKRTKMVKFQKTDNEINTQKKKKKLTKKKQGGVSCIDQGAAMQIGRKASPIGEHFSQGRDTKDWRRQFALLKNYVAQEQTKSNKKINNLKKECSLYVNQLENIEKCYAMRIEEKIDLEEKLLNAYQLIQRLKEDSRASARQTESLVNTNTQIFFQSMDLREQLEMKSKQLDETSLQFSQQANQAIAKELNLVAIIQKLEWEKASLQGQLYHATRMKASADSQALGNGNQQDNDDSSHSSSVETLQEYDTQDSQEEFLQATAKKQRQQQKPNKNNNKKCKKNKKRKSKRGGKRRRSNNNMEREILPGSSTESVATTNSDVKFEILLEEFNEKG